MKISKSRLLSLSLIFTILGLGFTAVSMAQRQLYVDLSNASQHIEKVQFISSGSDSAFLEQIGNGSVKIQTNNFILTQTGYGKENIISGKIYSSILGGEGNTIEGKGKNVIIGGKNNSINGEYNVILGGSGNNIENGKYSVIPGGKNNTIDGNYSVALGSNNRVEGTGSVVVGKSGYVKGDYSVALGKNSKVEANNSFLWTDGRVAETLTGDNLFVIRAKSGMVINTNKAHNFAKLTIGGPLVLSSKNIDPSIPYCGGGEGGGILKIENAGSQECLCSCDGSGRNSMLGKGRCISVCDSTIKPECGENSEVKKVCNDSKISFAGSGLCKMGQVVEGTGAFLMDKKDKIHWSCQTDDGTTIGCSGYVINAGETLAGCPGQYKCITGDDLIFGAILIDGSDTGLTGYVKKTLYINEEAAGDNKCAYICDYNTNYYYDVYPDGRGYCNHASDECTATGCKAPFEKTNETTDENHMSHRNCALYGHVYDACSNCEDGYEDLNGDGICEKSSCHHCAKNGFPYCFPINFSRNCTE